MKIIIDDKIPYIKGVLERFAEVVYLPGNKITPNDVRDAAAIITRTRTICDEKLLAGSKVKFIAAATIGFDHIDTDYCERAGIAWTNAPGCNSKSVEQYIASALMTIALEMEITLSEKTIGIVGVGNVGARVARICAIFGMKVLLNDPPRARKEGVSGFVELNEILGKADIISLHVPLNMEGVNKTFHLADAAFFTGTKKHPVIINSSRGEVAGNEDLKSALRSGQVSGAVIDCWENEPDIDDELLSLIDLGTPHIAGYSKDGKAKGTSMCIQAVSMFFGLGIDDWECPDIELPAGPAIIEIDGQNKSELQILSEVILATYDIRNDDQALRDSVRSFEKLRDNYPVRREFPYYEIKAFNLDQHMVDNLRNIGFKVSVK